MRHDGDDAGTTVACERVTYRGVDLDGRIEVQRDSTIGRRDSLQVARSDIHRLTRVGVHPSAITDGAEATQPRQRGRSDEAQYHAHDDERDEQLDQ